MTKQPDRYRKPDQRQYAKMPLVRLTLSALLLTIGAWAILCTPHVALAQGSTRWSAPVPISESPGGGAELSSVLIRDPYQNLHALWSKCHESTSQIYYRTDASGVWSTPIDVLALPYPRVLRMSATISPKDLELHVIWQNWDIQGDLYYSHVPLADAANTRAWAAPRILIPQVDGAGLSSDSEGVLRLFYGVSDAQGLGSSAMCSQSNDGGVTWSEAVVIHQAMRSEPGTLSVSPAFDESGRIHLGITFRTQTYGVYSEVGYTRSLDGGRTWEPYIAIARQSESTPNVSVIAPFAFDKDEIHLTWHDPRRMHMWSRDGGVTWSTPVQIMRLGAGFGGANALAKDSAGTLHVVCGVLNAVYASTFDGTQWMPPELIDSHSMDPHYQRILVSQGNQLHVMYNDGMAGNSVVWYAHKQVWGPQIERKPVPTAAAKSPSTATPSSVAKPTPTLQSPLKRPAASLPGEVSPLADFVKLTGPFLLPILLVLALVIMVMVGRTIRRR